MFLKIDRDHDGRVVSINYTCSLYRVSHLTESSSRLLIFIHLQWTSVASYGGLLHPTFSLRRLRNSSISISLVPEKKHEECEETIVLFLRVWHHSHQNQLSSFEFVFFGCFSHLFKPTSWCCNLQIETIHACILKLNQANRQIGPCTNLPRGHLTLVDTLLVVDFFLHLISSIHNVQIKKQ